MAEAKTLEKEMTQMQNRYRFAAEKSKKHIFIDNLTGGLAWGVGTIIGATIVVGILGIAISRTRQIPLVGDVVQVVIDEINQGRNSSIFNSNQSTTTAPVNTPTNPNQNPVVSYPTQ